MLRGVPTLILYGINGVYNYGCEAIVRGTEILLRELWSDANIVYLSSRPEDDAYRLAGSQIEICERQWYPRYHPRKIIAKAASLLCLPWCPRTEDFALFGDADAVLSIGGDMYTVGFKPGRYPKWLVESGEYFLSRHIPFVIWGASIGPFETNEEAKRLIVNHLRRVSLITVREPVTIGYLAGLGIERNVVACADPAFAVNTPVIRVARSSHRRIGVNYSPLSLAFALADGEADQFTEKQATALARLASQFDADLVLIPHVVCDFASIDDDRRYADRLRSLLTKLTMKEVRLVDDDPGFCGLRDTLLSCDIVIAARMHCAINAMSLGIPTLLAAYSQKAVGMARYVYGHDRWMLPVEATAGETIVTKGGELLAEQEQVHRQLLERLPAIRADAQKAVSALRSLLNS